jgi:Ca2+-binding EF-hand superfamily protein
MKHPLFRGATLAALASFALLGGRALPAPPPPGSTEFQDVVFFGDDRPFLLRLHVLVDDQPPHQAWQTYVRRWLKHLDRNGDGVLDAKEIRRAPTAAALQNLMRGGAFSPAPRSGLTMAELGKGPDNTVSLDDLCQYYRRNNSGPLQVGNGTGPLQSRNNFAQFSTQDRVGEALFRHLDLDKDAKLSREELRQAEATLSRLDADDDELVSQQELLGESPNPFAPVQTTRTAGPTSRLHANFLPVMAGESSDDLAARLLVRYDKDTKRSLVAADLGLDAETFAKLDRDGDGKLDEGELANWHRHVRPLELIARLGRTDVRNPVDLYGPRPKMAFAPDVTRGGPQAVSLKFTDSLITVQTAFGGRVVRPPARQSYLQQFRQADSQKRGYVDLKDLQQPPYQMLRTAFDFIDANDDGKVTEKEVTAFQDLLSGATMSFVTFAVNDQGRALFQLLDANRDGSLGRREMRMIASRLAVLDKNKDGFITPNEIPRHFQLAVRQGADGNGQFAVATRVAGPGPGPALSARGPLWFRKMDLNGDGDVSRREFLGSREDFDRIDADGDGLIDADEAERADVWMRARLKK